MDMHGPCSWMFCHCHYLISPSVEGGLVSALSWIQSKLSESRFDLGLGGK